MRSKYGKGGTNHILERGLFVHSSLYLVEICFVHMIVMIGFPVAKSIKCMLFWEGVVCVLSARLRYGYKIL